MFKISDYNFTTEADDGKVLLYNTRTGAFVAISEDKKQAAYGLLENPASEADAELKKGFIDNGFIVKADFDELQQIKNRFTRFKNGKMSMVLTLLASEDCNFRCPYCFIYNRRGMGMKPWVYKAVLELIKKSIVPDFNLTIDWFGGEPTLERENILAFMGDINNLAKDCESMKFNSRMVTNGYLLTKEAFLAYLNSGVTFFQVTVDGTQHSHDKTRILKNGAGTFKRIWENLESIKTGVTDKHDFKMKIRVNFLEGQDKEVESLVDKFQSAFGGDSRFSIYFRPVYNIKTSREDISSINGSVYEADHGTSKQLDYHFLSAKKTGVLDNETQVISPVPNPISGWCAAERNNSWTVGADGLLFKCDTYVGDITKASGKLKEDGTMEAFGSSFEWDTSVYDAKTEKCMACGFLPVCQGGCSRGRARRLANGNCYFNERLIKKAMVETHRYYSNTGGKEAVKIVLQK